MGEKIGKNRALREMGEKYAQIKNYSIEYLTKLIHFTPVREIRKQTEWVTKSIHLTNSPFFILLSSLLHLLCFSSKR